MYVCNIFIIMLYYLTWTIFLYRIYVRVKRGSLTGSVIINWGLATGIKTSDLDTLLGNTFCISFYVDIGLTSFENRPDLSMLHQPKVCTADRWQVDDFDRNHNVILQCTWLNI